jgi:hypothetical protein
VHRAESQCAGHGGDRERKDRGGKKKEKEGKVRRRRGAEGEGDFIDGRPTGRAVKAARGSAKPEQGPCYGRLSRRGREAADSGRRWDGSRFWRPAHRVK